ncbi:MAG: Unknown protein [uncultured Thiotrichaceae bacterium]|uniref:Uncharacterized protein n=1 Tax=uncultured Thiotrichaceae bacterium TaxID=298394 RepID=A0A6S6TMR7_9GAMM|nr:MAG: Unknown protein [uncultured Thiotrichaceae bacterium]
MTVKPRNYISVASIALFLGGLLWIAAFWFPVFKTAEREIAGYWVFVSGWMGFVVFQFAWYANLLLLIAVILMYTAPVRATVLAAVGLLVATQAFWFDVLPETTESVVITAKGLGFWFWYAGIFMMSVGVFFCLDSDEVTDVIETPEADADTKASRPLHTKVFISLPAEQTEQVVQAEAASQPGYNDYNPFIEPEAGPFERPIVEEMSPSPLPPPLPDTGNPFYTADAAPVVTIAPVVAETNLNLAEVNPEPEVSDVAPEPFALNKTDEELEATVPAVTSILQDAVFPEIKKPER